MGAPEEDVGGKGARREARQKHPPRKYTFPPPFARPGAACVSRIPFDARSPGSDGRVWGLQDREIAKRQRPSNGPVAEEKQKPHHPRDE